MAKWGTCDYKQLQKLRDNLAKLQSMDLDKFCRDVSKELAARLLSLVIKRTPVGQYPEETGKKGGTLRRGWTAKTEREAECTAVFGGGTGAKTYANSLPITKTGNTYTIEVINPVGYASYVEFGHRQTPGRYVPALGKALKKAWVPGQYFLTLSEQDLERIAPVVIERKLDSLLREVFNVSD